MAALKFAVPFGPVTMSGGSVTACCEISSITNHRVRILGFDLGNKGGTGTDTQIVISGGPSTGSSGGSTITPVKLEPSLSETILTTAKGGLSTQPTLSAIQYQTVIHPQGTLPKSYGFGQEIVMAGATTWALLVNPGSSSNVSAYGAVYCEE